MLVNNIGAVRIRLDGFLGTSDDEFDWALRLNFFTALRATRAALPPMLEQGGGAIVNVASVNAFFQPDASCLRNRSPMITISTQIHATQQKKMIMDQRMSMNG